METTKGKNKKLKIPNSYVIVFGIMILSSILTYIIPAGVYDVAKNEATGTSYIIPGTFHYVERSSTNLWQFINSIYGGLQKNSPVIMFTLLIGGYFQVIINTNAIDGFISLLIKKLGDKAILVIPIVMFVMSVLGAVGVMANPVVAVIPVGLLLAKKLNLDPMAAVGIMFIGAYSGFATSQMCPPTVQLAQKIAEVPLLSGFGFRTVVWLIIYVATTWYVMRYVKKISKDIKKSAMGEEFTFNIDEVKAVKFSVRHGLVLLVLTVGMTYYVYGALKYNWGMEYMVGTMFVVALLSGIIGDLSVDEIVKSFIKGCQNMVFSAMLIGCATSISIILTDGKIVHTIIYGLSMPLNYMPKVLVGAVMTYVNMIFHFFVSSGSGQAAIVMPLMSPLSDVVGISRQMAVSAYSYGDGFASVIFPSNGTMMAVIAIAGISYDKWIKWIMPLFAIWTVIITIVMIVGVAIGM